METYFYSFSNYLREKFNMRVRRLSMNAGFTCPTRDGTIDSEGCIYCNENGFSPLAGEHPPLTEQIEGAIGRARKRYKAEGFIAYFQNASGTYAPLPELKKAYDVIRRFPGIVGLYISTRPDCIDEKKLDLIESYAGEYDVWLEYGLQSARDNTLASINRRHTFGDFARAVEMTAKRNIKAGAHIILGLPGENREDMRRTAAELGRLPVSGIKLHALHVLRGTKLEKFYAQGDVKLLSFNEYAGIVCDFLELTDPRCVIFRLVSDANPQFLIAPRWINRKQEVIRAVNEEFKKRRTRQGSLWRTGTEPQPLRRIGV
jgi:radical SAM protein (TIGR01212 family)